MKKPTLFDLLSDQVIWNADACHWCDGDFASELDEMAFRVYWGQHGHLVLLAYHPECYIKQQQMFDSLNKIQTAD